MFQEFYRGSDLLHLPLFTLIFFVIFFVCTVAWIFLVHQCASACATGAPSCAGGGPFLPSRCR